MNGAKAELRNAVVNLSKKVMQYGVLWVAVYAVVDIEFSIVFFSKLFYANEIESNRHNFIAFGDSNIKNFFLEINF